ncbi:CHASE3 domain-containing protein [Pseudoalteromonas sp. SMS1]|uniref:CHASE3 domain-containing protein n=1 Tax=Pseudoalteromonas sp. SMS1 TaxID=2908894 RepID=UPI001F48286D|nr:CHASE3 domain-containing protein [Pseudoalteromonas sp. SMS1]MCF2858698.1 CHASE3 domain-containing protein [Pseudoalteromonas sp. SMS1]
MNYSFKSALFLFIGFSVFAGIVNLLIIVSSYTNKDEHEFWMIHTYEVIDLVNQLKVQIKSAETGQRGFLLTEDLEYLAPYRQGINLSLNTFEALKLKTRDNPTQQKRLMELSEILNRKFSELEQTIQFIEKGAKHETEKLVKTNIGRHLMEEIELILLAFEQEERNLLDKRTREYVDAKKLHTASILALEFVHVVLIIWLIYSIRDKVLKPIRVLGLYIKHYPESEKFEIAQDNNCIEVSELAQGIKSRCQESEKLISQLKQSEKKTMEDLQAITELSIEHSRQSELSIRNLIPMLQKHKEDHESTSSKDIDDMLKLAITANASVKDLCIYLENKPK